MLFRCIRLTEHDSHYCYKMCRFIYIICTSRYSFWSASTSTWIPSSTPWLLWFYSVGSIRSTECDCSSPVQPPWLTLTLAPALAVRLLRSGKILSAFQPSKTPPKTQTFSLALLLPWFLPVPSSLRSETAQLLNCPADPDHNSPPCKKKPSTPPH